MQTFSKYFFEAFETQGSWKHHVEDKRTIFKNSYDGYEEEIGRETLESYTYREGNEVEIIVSASTFYSEHSDYEYLSDYITIGVELGKKKLTPKAIGATANLIKDICKDHEYIIFDFFNSKDKEIIENLVKKIAPKINLYPTKIPDWDLKEIERYFEYMAPYKNNFLGFKNGRNLPPEDKLEKKIGDLF